MRRVRGSEPTIEMSLNLTLEQLISAVGLRNDIGCWKPDDLPTPLLEEGLTQNVALLLIGMQMTIDLDHDPGRRAGKIREERADPMLPAELQAEHPAVAHKVPDATLGDAGLTAQTTGHGGLRRA